MIHHSILITSFNLSRYISFNSILCNICLIICFIIRFHLLLLYSLDTATFEYGSKRRGGGSFFMQIASVSATGKTTRSILVTNVFISRERKCRSGVHPMTFAHNHSRAFRYRFFIISGTFIRWNTWEVRNEYSRINGVRNFLLVCTLYIFITDPSQF